nr:Region found in RelA / SpoT proteins [Streptococcus thermophilus]
MDLNSKPPFSKGDMKRAGKALMAGEGLDVEKYEDILVWHDSLIAETWRLCDEAIADYRAAVSYSGLIYQLDGEVVRGGRTKSEDTLVAKLARINIGLESVQDFAGARYDIPCGLTAQREIVRRMVGVLEAAGGNVEVKDYLVDHQHGYRAIHLWVRSNAGRIEVQVRTTLQAKWANLNESLGDRVGRGIRYGEPTIEEYGEAFPIIQRVRFFSDAIRSLEERREALLRDLSSEADVATELLQRGWAKSSQEELELVELMRRTSNEIFYLEGRGQ